MMTTFIITLSLFWPLPREGAFPIQRPAEIGSLSSLRAATFTALRRALTIFTDELACSASQAGRHSE